MQKVANICSRKKSFKEYICLCCNFDECHTLIQANNWVIALCHLNPLETVRWSPKQFGHTFLPRLVHVAHTLLWLTNSACIGNFPPTLWSIISWKSLPLFSPGWQTQPTISIHLKLLRPLLSQQAGGGWPNLTTDPIFLWLVSEQGDQIWVPLKLRYDSFPSLHWTAYWLLPLSWGKWSRCKGETQEEFWPKKIVQAHLVSYCETQVKFWLNFWSRLNSPPWWLSQPRVERFPCVSLLSIRHPLFSPFLPVIALSFTVSICNGKFIQIGGTWTLVPA